MKKLISIIALSVAVYAAQIIEISQKQQNDFEDILDFNIEETTELVGS